MAVTMDSRFAAPLTFRVSEPFGRVTLVGEERCGRQRVGVTRRDQLMAGTLVGPLLRGLGALAFRAAPGRHDARQSEQPACGGTLPPCRWSLRNHVNDVPAPPPALRGADTGLLGNHLFESLEVRYQRRFVHHPDLADHRTALGKHP